MQKVTNDELNDFIKEYKNGFSCREISQKYNRDSGTVRRKLAKVGIFESSINIIDSHVEKLIVTDYVNGLNILDISIKYNRPKTTIVSKLKSLNIYNKKETKAYSDDDLLFLKQHYPKGEWELIFDRFKVKEKQVIYNLANKHGICSNDFFWSQNDIEILLTNYEKMHGKINELIPLLDYKFTYKAITTKAKRLGLKTVSRWTAQEIDTLTYNYPHSTIDEMVILLPHRTRDSIITKAMALKIRNVVKFSKEQESFILSNWENISDEEMGRTIGKSKQAIRDKRLLLGLLRTKEKSSYNDLSEYIRRNNLKWKKESMEKCKYQCVFTNKRFHAIHHVYGLNLILNETLCELNIRVKKSMDDYTKEELKCILDTFRNNQSKYPLGVCVSKNIHKLFHNIYGYGNNTPMQWDEFVLNLKCNGIKNSKTA